MKWRSAVWGRVCIRVTVCVCVCMCGGGDAASSFSLCHATDTLTY